METVFTYVSVGLTSLLVAIALTGWVKYTAISFWVAARTTAQLRRRGYDAETARQEGERAGVLAANQAYHRDLRD